jgi:hypothetical protein
MKLKLRKGYKPDANDINPKAIDQDGICWFGYTGRWLVNVPWFRRSENCPKHWADDIAIVECVDGNRPYPITQKGTILVGKRRILSKEWNH